jgi:ABC-type multidrug transport system ATPase subunit
VGKKQLLSLTRALAHNPAILILDEVASSVDGETGALIQEGLKHLLAHRTALVIAHRLSTIGEMDRIVILDHGRIAKQGTYAQLLAMGAVCQIVQPSIRCRCRVCPCSVETCYSSHRYPCNVCLNHPLSCTPALGCFTM